MILLFDINFGLLLDGCLSLLTAFAVAERFYLSRSIVRLLLTNTLGLFMRRTLIYIINEEKSAFGVLEQIQFLYSIPPHQLILYSFTRIYNVKQRRCSPASPKITKSAYGQLGISSLQISFDQIDNRLHYLRFQLQHFCGLSAEQRAHAGAIENLQGETGGMGERCGRREGEENKEKEDKEKKGVIIFKIYWFGYLIIFFTEEQQIEKVESQTLIKEMMIASLISIIIKLYCQTMYDSNYPSNKKRSNVDDTTYPTAQKSPYRQAPLTRTPNRSQATQNLPLHHTLSETKRSIDEIIQQVSAKKSMNQQAIQEVRNVNQEIVTNLSYIPNPVRSAQKNRTAEHKRIDSRDIVVTSQFEYQQASEEDLKRSQQSAISQENLDLRSRLNQQIRRNNELMLYAKSLQTENATLKSSRQVRGSTHDQEYSSLIEQNRYLRSQLSHSQQGPTADILEQLRRLKEENSQLRKDTITLLHRQH